MRPVRWPARFLGAALVGLGVSACDEGAPRPAPLVRDCRLHLSFDAPVPFPGEVVVEWAPPGRSAGAARRREAMTRGPDGPFLATLTPAPGLVLYRFEVDGRPLATRPRGYDADNPRIGLLRCRMLVASSTYPPASWMDTRKALTNVRTDWQALQPLVEWLADHVGPADDPGAGD